MNEEREGGGVDKDKTSDRNGYRDQSKIHIPSINNSLERTTIMREDVDATPWPHQSRYEHQQPCRYGGGAHPHVTRSEYQKIADNLDFASATETRCPIYNFSKTACDDLRQVLRI